jgi:hypothetical protein
MYYIMAEIINPFEEPPVTPAPLLPDGKPKARFEVMMRKGKGGNIEKAIFIDGEFLDWSVDMSSLAEAFQMGPKFYKAAQKDIERHFTESVSEVLGRKVTAEDIKLATKTGWI